MSFSLIAALSVLTALDSCLATMERERTSVTAAAEATVARMKASPNAVIEVPRQWCWGFHQEMVGRAGGLAQIGSPDVNQPEDIVLFAVRSWEHFGPKAAELLRGWKREGKLVVAIGSDAGRPTDFAPDFFIDNGAPDGSRRHAAANAIANVVLGWTFCLEYAAAWSREGRFPAVWRTVAGDDCWAVNAGIFSPDGRVRFYACDRKVPAGELATVYLNRYRRRLGDLGSNACAEQVDAAAELIADRLASGKRAAFSSIGHLILYEATEDLVSPMFGFVGTGKFRSRVFPLALDKGDLLVWLGYTSASTRWADYMTPIRAAGADIIFSAAPTLPPQPPPEGTVAQIAQHWLLPDAEVAVPAPPGMMAPLSEVDRCVLARLIDAAVAAKLSARGLNVPKGRPRDEAGFAALVREAGPRFPPPKACASKPPFRGYARWERWDAERVLVFADGRWGLADNDGKLLAPVKYENLRIASEHLLATQVGTRYGVLDHDGREVIAPTLQAVIPPWKWLQVKVAFMQDGKFGVLDPVTGAVAKPATLPNYPAPPAALPPDTTDTSTWERGFVP